MNLTAEYLPATGAPRQDLVLLHGWGCSREIWRPFLSRVRPWANVTLVDLPGCVPGLAASSDLQPGVLLRAIEEVTPTEAVYMGWSLGGQLALAMAQALPTRVRAVVTVCSNPKFVAEGDWPGMDLRTFADFRDSYAASGRSALTRFDSLQVEGSANSRALLRQLRASRTGEAGDELLPGLGWLEALDQRQLLRELEQPVLMLQAAGDQLVPAETVDGLRSLAEDRESLQVEALDGSHVLPLEAPVVLADRVHEFLDKRGALAAAVTSPGELEKQDVAQSFSRAAGEYDSVATLQRNVGNHLLNCLDQVTATPARVLDLGCGTGHFYPALVERFPSAEYVGLDLAAGMIDFARQQHPAVPHWVVGDAEALPLAADSVDLIFSSLTFQWCHRPELLFAELGRVLRPGGRCVFTSLGPDTLRELRAAWAAVDDHQHVNTFLPAQELSVAAKQVGNLSLELRGEHISMRYGKVRDLLRELKVLGAHNVNRARPSGLTGRRALQGMLEAYEHWREGDTLPATYDVIYGVLEKA